MPHPDLPAEQRNLDAIYAHLDGELQCDEDSLRGIMLEDDPEPEARLSREIEYHRLQERIERLRTAASGLVFGRIDIADDDPENPVPGHPELDRRYIGRMGLSDENDDYRGLLMDWRAPQARPFYLATTAHPEDVTLRRHLRTRGRKLREVDDEWLSLPAGGADDGYGPDGASSGDNERDETGVGGEKVLREVLDSARTGHMSGIVETIQREQDVIIRDQTRQAMVVQGGPGTGKTAVALHRVAWLLYTHRERLEKTGVLILGPNPAFLEYISQVLPSLGETGVVLSTIANLYPGISGSGGESLVSQEVKGSAAMVDILTRAVQDLQVVPDEPIDVELDQVAVAITPEMVHAARSSARRTRRPHNLARPTFREHMYNAMSRALADTIGADPFGGENLLSAADVEDLRTELAEDDIIAEVIEELWPEITAEQLLSDLFSDRDRIDSAARDYDEVTAEALYREDGGSFSPSDPPLLDELMELLGTTRGDADEEDRNSWLQQIEEAQDALDVLTGSASQDLDDGFAAEILSAYDLIDAEGLAERQRDRDSRTTAQRAAADRTWAYGHVIVDEAQEMSQMAWRMIHRRSPNGWMTLVGDVAQTGSPAGADSWADALDPIIGNRWRMHEMTINYRTPTEIMELAVEVLHQIDPEATEPTSIRSTGVAPVVTRSVAEALLLPDASDNRLTAIITPESMVADLDAPEGVQLLGVRDSKGLEFDNVILVEPDRIVDESPMGLQDVYVAMTRATQRLVVVSENGAPKCIPGL